MKKVDTPDGEIRVYEDQQSGDTFDEFEENQSRERYFETVMDYFRSPEYRMIEDDPQKPEVVKKIEKAWEESPLDEWTARPENKEERKQKIELFWKLGKIIAEFYESIGHKRKQCPQCGYYSLAKAEKCGQSASYDGCGYEFNYARFREFNLKDTLEKALGSINPDADNNTDEDIEEWGEEPYLEGMHSFSFIEKFKKFYWLFPEGNYSNELSWFHQYVFASYYNARVIVLPEYWDIVEKAKNGNTIPAKDVRQILTDAVDEYEKDPREKFLTEEKYREYDET